MQVQLTIFVLAALEACTPTSSSPPTANSSGTANAAAVSGPVKIPLEPALPNVVLGSYSYKPSTAPLYGSTGQPAPGDVNQGNLGDCSLLSTLIGLALQYPQYLAKNLKSVGQDANGHEVYAVTLYYPLNGNYAAMTATQVLVSNQVLVNSSGATFDDIGSPLWPTLYEKAFALLNDQYNLVQLANARGFQSLANGIPMPIALQVVTGQNSTTTTYVNNGSTNVDAATATNILGQEDQGVIIMNLDFNSGGGLSNLGQVAAAHELTFDGTTMTLPSGLPVTIETDDSEGNFRIQGTGSQYVTIIGSHAYVAEGVVADAQGNTFVVMDNPWNWAENLAGNEAGATTFQLNFKDFMVLAQRLTYVTAPAH